MNLYTVKDKKASHAQPPFAAPNDAVACRLVMESLRDGQSMLAKYPGDFQVIHVGEYAEDDGWILPAKDVRLVVEVQTLVDSMAAALKSQMVMPGLGG